MAEAPVETEKVEPWSGLVALVSLYRPAQRTFGGPLCEPVGRTTRTGLLRRLTPNGRYRHQLTFDAPT